MVNHDYAPRWERKKNNGGAVAAGIAVILSGGFLLGYIAGEVAYQAKALDYCESLVFEPCVLMAVPESDASNVDDYVAGVHGVIPSELVRGR